MLCVARARLLLAEAASEPRPECCPAPSPPLLRSAISECTPPRLRPAKDFEWRDHGVGFVEELLMPGEPCPFVCE
jgi:hypothetical protein